MRRTLYRKLALALTALVAALLVAQLVVWMRVSQVYEDEAIQALHRELAGTLLTDEVDPKWGLPVLESEFETLMHLNPSVELYWLDPAGGLLAYSAPEGSVVRQRVDVEPIRAFIERGEMLPIYGDDPRDAGREVIFSAAPVLGDDGGPTGFLYVVLEGQRYQSLGGLMSRSRIAQLAVGSVALVSVFGLVVGLVLFRSITRRVTDLDQRMATFLADADPDEPIAPLGADELDRLRATFDHLADRVSQQVNALEEVDRLRRELVASVSHDLRTPLASLRGYLETLQLMGDQLSREEQLRYLEAAARHTDRLSALVDSLLELARLESGGVELRRERFALGELVQDVLQPHVLRAEEAGVRLEASVAPGLAPVHADIGLVERVLENLVENALRHTPDGGDVSVRAERAGAGIRVEVTDTGRGIPSEALPHIFDRFYRVTDVPGEGMGLGLAVVHRILDLHGEAIEVESEPGRGTCFRFHLPCAGAAAEA
ncbi:MAG: ATP-binding protein [Myxococcota bacterium]